MSRRRLSCQPPWSSSTSVSNPCTGWLTTANSRAAPMLVMAPWMSKTGPWPSCSGTAVTPELCQASNSSRYQILPPRVRVPKTVANPQTSRSGFIISAPPTARPTALDLVGDICLVHVIQRVQDVHQHPSHLVDDLVADQGVGRVVVHPPVLAEDSMRARIRRRPLVVPVVQRMTRRGPQRSQDTRRRPSAARRLDLEEPDSAARRANVVACPAIAAWSGVNSTNVEEWGEVLAVLRSGQTDVPLRSGCPTHPSPLSCRSYSTGAGCWSLTRRTVSPIGASTSGLTNCG